MQTSQESSDKYSLISRIYKLMNGLAEEQKLVLMRQLLKSDLETHMLKLILDMSDYQQIAVLNQLEELAREKTLEEDHVVELNVDERRDLRKPCPIVVEVLTGDLVFTDQMQDISIGGTFIKTTREISIGQEIDLSFSLPEENGSFVMKGEIVRCTDDGIGVKFLNLTHKEHKLIKKFLEDMEKM